MKSNIFTGDYFVNIFRNFFCMRLTMKYIMVKSYNSYNQHFFFQLADLTILKPVTENFFFTVLEIKRSI
jgi:hypothetical protein